MRGEAEIDSEGARQARQEEARPYIRRKADGGFRHGEDRLLGDDAVGAVNGDAEAAAHADAVDQRYIRLGEGRDGRVEQIFLGEEGLRLVDGACQDEGANSFHVAAGTEGTA